MCVCVVPVSPALGLTKSGTNTVRVGLIKGGTNSGKGAGLTVTNDGTNSDK